MKTTSTRSLRDDLKSDTRRVREKTRASLMSDTKWRKLLGMLDGSGLELRQCVIKFVDVDAEKTMRRPAHLYPPRPWIDTAEFGPISLRSIEWMLFPCVAEFRDTGRTIPATHLPQDVEKAAELIAALGRYPVELTERGLTITGYLPAAAA
jgi:hypothetical protein